ncbi:MAG: MFS transporter [Actinomycetota bacterium]
MSDRAGLLSPRHRQLSVAIYTTIALVAFEGTSVAAAIPDIAADLGDVGLVPWIITGYLFTLGLSTVLAGPFVDALGSRALFVWSTVIFAGSGFTAGLVGDVTVLVSVRLVQGAASGFLFAAAIAAVNLGFPESLTGRAFAANATIWGVMGAAAPAIAAVLLDVASWRWIFFINLPLGAIAWFAGRSTMPDRLDDAEPLHVDLLGAAFIGVFTLTTILAVDDLGVRSAAFGVIAVGAVAAYVRHARRADRPLVTLGHIAVQPYASLAIVPSLMLAAAFCINVYVTLYVAGGRSWSTGSAAWSVVFFTVGWTLGANLSSRLLDRATPISVMAFGLAVGVAGTSTAAVGAVADTSLAGL